MTLLPWVLLPLLPCLRRRGKIWKKQVFVVFWRSSYLMYALIDINLLVSELKIIFFSFLLQFAILVVFSYVQNSCVIEWNKTILQAYIFYFMCVHMALLHSRLFMPIQWLIACSNFVVLMDLFSKDFWLGISKLFNFLQFFTFFSVLFFYFFFKMFDFSIHGFY